MIGKLFVSSSPNYPSSLWSLPKLSDKVFAAEAFMYEIIDKELKTVAYDDKKYINTGLLGFLYGNQVFILGSLQDIVQQVHGQLEDYKISTNYLNWSTYMNIHFMRSITQSIAELFCVSAW